MFTLAQAGHALKALHVRPEHWGFSVADVREGMNVELEHRNVTRGTAKRSAQIALAHLMESPNYYRMLRKLEKRLKKGKLPKVPRLGRGGKLPKVPRLGRDPSLRLSRTAGEELLNVRFGFLSTPSQQKTAFEILIPNGYIDARGTWKLTSKGEKALKAYLKTR